MVVSGQPSGKRCDFNSDTGIGTGTGTVTGTDSVLRTPASVRPLKQLSQASNLYKFFTLTSKQCEKFAMDDAAVVAVAEVCLPPWGPF